MAEILERIEQDPELQVSVRAAFFQVRNNTPCVLLGMHKRHQQDMFPGGRIEQVDYRGPFPIDETLARELREELGLNIWDVFNKYYSLEEMAMGIIEYFWEGHDTLRLDYCLVLYLPAGWELPFNENNLPEDSELSHVRWESIYNIGPDLFPNTAAILRILPEALANN